ncbi:MAG: hypothetical protein V7731_22500 [Amphritea sp.]
MKKLLLVLGLVFIIQLQPLQVHAIVLDAEQAGHTAGQLSHSHGHQHDNETDADGRLVEMVAPHEHSADLQHTSDCHPGHILFPPVALIPIASRSDSLPYAEPFNGFISAEFTLDTPPPRYNS